jgi:hypothetical protein
MNQLERFYSAPMPGPVRFLVGVLDISLTGNEISNDVFYKYINFIGVF